MSSGFGQFCPVAVACEVFSGRWTPLILRELLAGAQKFNEIHRGLPLISRPLLARRLRELEGAGVISMEPLPTGRGHRYLLTEAGREFRSVIDGLAAWGQRWTTRVDRKNLDPGLLMWNMRRRVALDRLPPRRVVARFRFTRVALTHRGPRMFWLILDRPDVDLCVSDPGFEVDLHVEADLAAMARFWLGDLSFDSVRRSKQLQLFGPKELVQQFPTWWKLSRFAAVPRREATADARPAPARLGSG